MHITNIPKRVFARLFPAKYRTDRTGDHTLPHTVLLSGLKITNCYRFTTSCYKGRNGRDKIQLSTARAILVRKGNISSVGYVVTKINASLKFSVSCIRSTELSVC